MRDQYLFDEWQYALSHKQTIINQRGSDKYHYWVTIETKEKTKILWFINGEPERSYHSEKRFNGDLYKQDLTAADQRINNCIRAVDNKISEYRRELEVANRTKPEIDGLKANIAHLRSQTNIYCTSVSELQEKVDQTTYEISSISNITNTNTNNIQVAEQTNSLIASKITNASKVQAALRHQTDNYAKSVNDLQTQASRTSSEVSNLKIRASTALSNIRTAEQEHHTVQNMINDVTRTQTTLRSQTNSYHESINQLQAEVNQVTHQINHLQNTTRNLASSNQNAEQEHSHTQTEITRTAENVNNFSQQISNIDQQIYNTLSGVSTKQRTEMLAAIIDRPKTEQTINIIETLGYDVNHLAHIAIEQNDISLLNYGLLRGAQCTKYAVNGFTLLQRAILADKNLLVSKILASGQDLDTSIVNAVSKSDFKTIRTLISHDEDYLHKPIHGYSLLHIAISAKKPEVVAEILVLDTNHTCLNELTSFGESPFKLAVRSSDEQIINMLIPIINLEQELSALISSRARVLFERAISYCEISPEVSQFLLIKALENDELEIADLLSSKGANLSEVFERVIANQADQEDHILQNILEMRPDFIELLGSSSMSSTVHQASLSLLGAEHNQYELP